MRSALLRAAAAAWSIIAVAAILAGPDSASDDRAHLSDELIAQADSLTDAGDLERALEHYLRACELDPRAVMALRGVGFVLLELGRPEEAIPYLRNAARIDPKASRPIENLGLAHAAIYDRTARELYELAPRMPSGEVSLDNPLLKRSEELRAKLGEKDWRSEALAYFREAVRMDPGEAKYWYNLGTTLNQYRPLESREAMAALLKAVAIDGTYYPALRNLALSLRREGWFREAREMCLQLQTVAPPDDPAVPSILADIAFDEGDLVDAERHYLRELELEPASIHAHLGLAALYRRQGDLERSRERTEQAIALDPEHEKIIRQSIEHEAGH